MKRRGKIKRDKRGMEFEEIIKLILVVFVLVVLVLGAWILLKGNGGSILDGIRRMLHFGR
jgi:hypothetical protein